MDAYYKGLICYQDGEGMFQQEVQEFHADFLPQNEVHVKVYHSSLNYKDALSAFGKNKVTKNYPHVTGIDAAGVIVSDTTGHFDEGEEVIVQGFDLGMNTFGGHATHISVPASWVVKKPAGISLKEAMYFGTAGLSAVLAWQKMEPYIENQQGGSVLVTGASGGVGMVALALLSLQEDLNVVACSSKKAQYEKLKSIGATEVIHPSAVLVDKKKPLVKPVWNGAIDNLGGDYLASILAASHKEAAIASIGLVSSMELRTTVLPFILNGVNLLGINAADVVADVRETAWKLLARDKSDLIQKITEHVQEISLYELPGKMRQMLDGKLHGRVVVNTQ